MSEDQETTAPKIPLYNGDELSVYYARITVGQLRAELAAFDQGAPVMATWESVARALVVDGPGIGDRPLTDAAGRIVVWIDADA